MKEIEEMKRIMDTFFESIESPAEKKKREDERAKENNHRKEEGLSCI